MVGKIEQAEERAGTELTLPRSTRLSGVKGCSASPLGGQAGSSSVWRSLWQRDGGQCLNWPAGVMGRLVALLAWLLHCWH